MTHTEGRPLRRERFRWDVVDRGILAIILALSTYLALQLLQMASEAWQRHPRPGKQVAQWYRGKVGQEADAVECDMEYLFYLPPQYDPRQRWPLVVFLHGSGERGCDLNLVRRVGLPKQIEEGQRPAFLLVSPQCPPESLWDPEILAALIEQVSQTWSVDRDRVYVTGFSMGGYGTWHLACSHPERFAAIAPLAGGGVSEKAWRLTKLPIWAFHGESDETVPLAASEEMVQAVRACGGQVEFTIYPGIGHGICEMTYQDGRLLEWLLAQRRGVTQPRKSAQEPPPLSLGKDVAR